MCCRAVHFNFFIYRSNLIAHRQSHYLNNQPITSKAAWTASPWEVLPTFLAISYLTLSFGRTTLSFNRPAIVIYSFHPFIISPYFRRPSFIFSYFQFLFFAHLKSTKMSAIKLSITFSSAVIITLFNILMLFNLIAAHIISPNIADVSRRLIYRCTSLSACFPLMTYLGKAFLSLLFSGCCTVHVR